MATREASQQLSDTESVTGQKRGRAHQLWQSTITALKQIVFPHSSSLRVKQKSWNGRPLLWQQRWIFKVQGLEFEVQQADNDIKDAGACVYTAVDEAKLHDLAWGAAAAAIKQ